MLFEKWTREHESEIISLADFIFENPEISFQETKSSKALAAYLEENEFKIQWNIAGLDTAFAAEWGSGEPVIGFLAEYDALPGLGQKISPDYEPMEGPGHGCGHNLLGTACAGAVCMLKEWMEKSSIQGTLRLYGCPAEEVVRGKIIMNEAGVFQDLSLAVTWHPFDRNRVSYDIWQAQDIKNYKFYGVAAHASKYPERGRSALDAAELMNVGVNYLREHVEDDVRIHYTYTNTDGPANIVPAYAATNYFIRSAKWERTQEVANRVDDCARGAALMTGTRVEIEQVTCNKEMKVNRTLAEIYYQAMQEVPRPQYTKAEIEFAQKLSREAELENGGELFGDLEPLENEPVRLAIGTDVSDVSHTVPTIMLSAAAMCKGTPLHHWAATSQVGMSIGEKGMLYAMQSMALGTKNILSNPELIKKVWEEHNRQR